MRLEASVLCLECNGRMTLQDRYRKVIKIHMKNGSTKEVTRISEHWYCHNGHLRMKNYSQEEKIKVS